jgi:hypothetical protein
MPGAKVAAPMPSADVVRWRIRSRRPRPMPTSLDRGVEQVRGDAGEHRSGGLTVEVQLDGGIVGTTDDVSTGAGMVR